MTDDLVDYLLDKEVKLIGIDFHSIQLGENHVKIDKYTENRGTFVVENMTNLDKIPNIVKLSLKWNQGKDATAIPVEIEVVKI